MQRNSNTTPGNSTSSSKKNRQPTTPSTSTSSRGKRNERKAEKKVIKRGSATTKFRRRISSGKQSLDDETEKRMLNNNRPRNTNNSGKNNNNNNAATAGTPTTGSSTASPGLATATTTSAAVKRSAPTLSKESTTLSTLSNERLQQGSGGKNSIDDEEAEINDRIIRQQKHRPRRSSCSNNSGNNDDAIAPPADRTDRMVRRTVSTGNIRRLTDDADTDINDRIIRRATTPKNNNNTSSASGCGAVSPPGNPPDSDTEKLAKINKNKNSTSNSITPKRKTSADSLNRNSGGSGRGGNTDETQQSLVRKCNSTSSVHTMEEETQRTESGHKKLSGGVERTFEDTTQSSVYKKLDRDKPVSPLQKQGFIDFVRNALLKGVKGILDEYANEIVRYSPTGTTRKAFDSNTKKNRYTDVICIDQTRIILKNQASDYIHANVVRGGPLINSFILTQGPVKETVKDFWRMIVQEQVGNIIMLCDIMESGKLKCQQYWPPKEGNTLDCGGGITIKNTNVDTVTDQITVISTLEVIVDKKDKFVLKHHHWKSWPDKSVPKSYFAPFRLLRTVRHSSKPTVVHCSAGIGRTGSIVALEVCYQQLLSEQSLSVLDMVKWIRKQRCNAVQTDTQYLYLFKCLISFATKCNLLPSELLPKLRKFDEDYQRSIDDKDAKKKLKRDVDIEYTE